jgi:ABC-2 type transport system ATP-binding protein
METFILNLKSSLDKSPDLPEFSCRLIDAATLEVDIHKQQSLNELFISLTKYQIEVVSMRNKTNRLEELFINLTQDKYNDKL